MAWEDHTDRSCRDDSSCSSIRNFCTPDPRGGYSGVNRFWGCWRSLDQRLLKSWRLVRTDFDLLGSCSSVKSQSVHRQDFNRRQSGRLAIKKSDGVGRSSRMDYCQGDLACLTWLAKSLCLSSVRCEVHIFVLSDVFNSSSVMNFETLPSHLAQCRFGRIRLLAPSLEQLKKKFEARCYCSGLVIWFASWWNLSWL